MNMNAKNKNPYSDEIKFGGFFVFVFLLAAIFFFVAAANEFWALIFAVLAASFLILTLFAPALLAPLNRAWMALGHVLGRIVSPIVLGLIFFVLITPVALIGRIAGRDPLRLKRRAVASYWIQREPPGPTPDSFKNQF
jgi:hypothetical protein